MYYIIRTFLFLAVINFLAGNVPGFMPELSKLTAFLLSICWAGLFFPLKGKQITENLRAVIVGFALFSLLLFDLFCFPALAIIIWILMKAVNTENDGKIIELSVCLITVFVFSVFQVFYHYHTYTWYFLQKISLWYSPVVTQFFNNKMTLGASASGLHMSISILCYCLGLAHYRREGLFVIGALFTPVATNIFFLAVQKPFGRMIHLSNKTLNPDIFDLQILLIIIASMFLYILWRKIDLEGIDNPLWEKVVLRPFIVCLFCIFSASFILAFDTNGISKQGKILFCDKGTNWKVPVYGKLYGQNSAGMFGMMPNYLRIRGFHTEIYKKDLTKEKLTDTAVLVVFNPSNHFSKEEQEAIRIYIENGGSLLVAGDHTDVAGIMKPINEILTPFNISLQFDTALPVVTGWINGLEKRAHPVTKTLAADYETGIWVGGSLGISPPAEPVIIGKYGWSDYGNYLNKKAYLGDYKRSSEEQLGDVVLVASSEYGKGRVLVFGDTSTFQNGILGGTYFFIDRVFNFLLTENHQFNYPEIQFLVSVFLFCIAGFFINRNTSQIIMVAGVVAIFLTVFLVQKTLSKPAHIPDNINKTFYAPVYIDASHLERFAKLSSSENSVYGITLNLLRNRLMPLFIKDFSASNLDKVRLLIVIAPTIQFSLDEIQRLKAFMEKGGEIIWSVGWEDMAASRSFLDAFNFSIDSVPIGSQEVEVGHYTVKFVEAWPIVSKNANVETIAQKWGYPLMVYQPVGKGGLFLIADSKFLLSHNIESYKNYKIRNIQFFKYLIDRFVFDRKVKTK